MNNNINKTTGKKMAYIVVFGIKGITYFLQYGGVVSHGFYNNRPKAFKTLQTAIKWGNNVYKNRQADYAQVWQVYEGENIKDIIKHEGNRCLYMIQKAIK